MKRFYFIVIALVLAAGCSLDTVAKRPNLTPKQIEKIEKEQKKIAKQIAKERTKDGWKIEQPTTMESAMAEHNVNVKVNGLEQMVQASTGKKSRSICRKQIQIDAPNAYAKKESQVIVGEVVNKDRMMEDDESENFIAEYTAKLAKEVAGDLQESFSLYRKNPDGTYDMEIYYVIDPEAAHAAKIKAAKALNELQKLDDEWKRKIIENLED